MKYTDLKGYLIAVDLDGTIISNYSDIDEESFNILKYMSLNNYIIIATGRPWRSSKQFYEKLTLNTPIINYNGAYVHNEYDPSFKESMTTIPKEKLIDIVTNNKHILINAFCEIRDDLYVLKMDDIVKPFLDLDGAKLHLGPLNETLTSNSNGAILFAHEGTYKILEEYVNKNAPEILLRPWKISDIVIVELYNKNISKAKGLEKIANYYHIEKEKIIAFGDGHNDIEMLKFAHIGVALENGHEELIKCTKFKTKSIYEHGVAYFLKNFEF